jgi:hypothetical protein
MKKENIVNDFINTNSSSSRNNDNNDNGDNNKDHDDGNGANYSILSGKVMAAFIAASIGLLSIGVLTYLRDSILWFVVIWKPTAALGGVMLYGYLIWVISWIILYFSLRNVRIKKSNDNNNCGRTKIKRDLKVCLIVFFLSLTITTILIEISLKWLPLF